MINSANAQEKTPSAAVRPSPANLKLEAAKSELNSLDAAIDNQVAKINVLSQPPKQVQTWWTTSSAMTMCSAVLVFGLFSLVLASYVMRKGHNWEAVLKIFGSILIVVMTVFLVVAGYDDKQVAPAIGLLGTIAGYLLGKDFNKNAEPTPAPKT